MNEPKPFASLGATLLARKGGAKPAMRPQAATPMALGGNGSGGGAQATALKQDFDTLEALEDLGWNDMGEDDAPADRSAEVHALTPAPHNPESEAKTDAGSPKPLVRSIHEELAEMLEKGQTELPVPKPKPQPKVAPKPQPKAVPAPAKAKARASAAERELRRAAFTLRLDAKRHLKLRLASTVKNRSAQQLVTAALDKYLAEIPEVEALAAQVKRN
jgi:hypothetical protein